MRIGSDDFDYVTDITSLGAGGRIRRKLSIKHMEVLIKAFDYQTQRFKDSEVFRPITKEETLIGSKILELLQRLWRKKQEKDGKINRTRFTQISGKEDGKE